MHLWSNVQYIFNRHSRLIFMRIISLSASVPHLETPRVQRIPAVSECKTSQWRRICPCRESTCASNHETSPVSSGTSTIFATGSTVSIIKFQPCSKSYLHSVWMLKNVRRRTSDLDLNRCTGARRTNKSSQGCGKSVHTSRLKTAAHRLFHSNYSANTRRRRHDEKRTIQVAVQVPVFLRRQ